MNGVSIIMLGVSDLDRSTRFYEQTLGRPVRFRAGDAIVFVDGGPIMIGLNASLGSQRNPIAGATEVVFSVDSVKASHRALLDRAAVCIIEPRHVTEKDWAATFADPDGHFLTLFGPE
jgi:catechol 2,3-dioxygenase-like lactoylglutathione lyase family enzyme